MNRTRHATAAPRGGAQDSPASERRKPSQRPVPSLSAATGALATEAAPQQLPFDLDRLLDNMAAARSEYYVRAHAWAVAHCRARGSVTADDLHAGCPPPEGVDGRIIGAILRPPVFRPVAYEQSVRRAVNHGRTVRRFQLVSDRPRRAQRWQGAPLVPLRDAPPPLRSSRLTSARDGRVYRERTLEGTTS